MLSVEVQARREAGVEVMLTDSPFLSSRRLYALQSFYMVF